MIERGNIIVWNDLIDKVVDYLADIYDNVDGFPSYQPTINTVVYDTGWRWGVGGPKYANGWAWSNRWDRGEPTHRWRIYTTETTKMNVTPASFNRYTKQQIKAQIEQLFAKHGIGRDTMTGKIIRSNHIYYICQIFRQWLKDITYVICLSHSKKIIILCTLLTESAITEYKYGRQIITDDYPLNTQFDEYIKIVIANVFKDMIIDVNKNVSYDTITYKTVKNEHKGW